MNDGDVKNIGTGEVVIAGSAVKMAVVWGKY